MRDHIRKNVQSYVHILKEEDNFSGMEDYIARKNNTIDKHRDLRSSFLKLGNEQEELRRKSKQKDQREKVVEDAKRREASKHVKELQNQMAMNEELERLHGYLVRQCKFVQSITLRYGSA